MPFFREGRKGYGKKLFFMAWKMFVLIFVFLFLCGCVQEAVPVKEVSEGNADSGFEARQVRQGVVERVIDGDTLVLVGGERVRLIGIDTPEKGMPCSQEAKKRLEQLVLGKHVLLAKDVSERDKYGRLVRYVYSKRVFVNLAIVEEGFATSYEFEPDTLKSEVFKEAENMAKENGGCLWKFIKKS